MTTAATAHPRSLHDVDAVCSAATVRMDGGSLSQGSDEHRARRVGPLHGLSNAAVDSLFAAAWMMRDSALDVVATTSVLMIEVCALAIGTVAGWCGGELVDRLAVGIDDGPNLKRAGLVVPVAARIRMSVARGATPASARCPR